MSSVQGPSDIAAQFCDALRDARWTDAANLLEPNDLVVYRERELSMLTAWAARRDEIRELRNRKEGMIAWSSEATLDQKELARLASTPLRLLKGLQTLGELAQLSPLQFAATMMEATNAPIAPPGSESFARSDRAIIGQVHEGEVAHVIYRQVSPAIVYDDPYHIEVLRLRREGGIWYVMLTAAPHDVVNTTSLTLMEDDLPEWLPPP